MSHKKKERISPLTLQLPCAGVDSHAHLDGSAFDADREEVLERAQVAGVARIGNVFLGVDVYRERREMFAAHPEIFYLLGTHPCDGMQCDAKEIEGMRAAFLEDTRLKAVGEIGLDFYWDDCPKEIQYQAFERQLALARELEKPVVIHCRDAMPETLAFLESRDFAGYPLLWHCFGGDRYLAKRIIRNGWHISIPGPVTFRANTALREALQQIPNDRLLLETDCPYLAPEPWRGTRNEPALTAFTAACIAQEKRMSPEALWRLCGENAYRFFVL